METLPKTLQDAILVSRALGLRYLWVDALCIIQDSPQDWVEQAGKMAEIYQDAHLTISADSAEGSNSGFLADRDLRAIRSCHHTRARLSIHPEMPPVFDIIDSGSLSNRGWILQERIFSRRIIHWSHLEVGWECREMQASERDPQGQANADWLGSNAKNMLVSRDSVNMRLNGVSSLPRESIALDDTFQNIRSNVYNAWYRLIQEYSRRLLTYPDKDKLIALSSISKTYHKRCSRILGPEESYICGLWKGDLARGLAFSYGTGTMERKRLDMPEVTPCNLEDPSTWKYRPPSFSWARGDSWAAWGDWLETSHGLSEHDVEVLEIHNTTTTADIWGPVESCWIVLRGVVCSREMLRAVPSYNYQLDDDVKSYDLLQRERYLRLNVALIPDGLYQQTWLMIHPVGELDEYRRIGIVSIVEDFSLDWTDKTNIKLV